MDSGHSARSLGPTHHHNELAVLTRRADCEPAEPANTVTQRLQTALQNGGNGYILSLCPNQRYMIQAPILFTQPNQEISTAGYPRGEERAMLVVSGPAGNGQGHSVAIDGTCSDCDGVKIRNIQIDGMRNGAPPLQNGGNIEIGGDNSNQLIEWVKTSNPRSWTCMHVVEGSLSCNNITIRNNDIGPCGVDAFQEWADGISLACMNSVVRDNMIVGATDGGIVVFGSPGSLIENNTIWILDNTLLGGINLVDFNPWNGDYTNTIVRKNLILGGFATDAQDPGDTKGANFESAVIKIGIAVGPRTWFGDKFGAAHCRGGVIEDNVLAGAFSYGIAVTSSDNFTIQGNALMGNTSFIGGRGVNCSESDVVPPPGPWVIDWATVGTDMNLESGRVQSDFVGMSDGDSLTCVLPPNGGDFWPFGLNPTNGTIKAPGAISESSLGGGGGGGNIGGTVAGVVIGILVLGVVVFFGRKWLMRKLEEKKLYEASKRERRS